MITQLTSVKDVIDELGGTKVVAGYFGIGVNAVSNWRVKNRFPAKTFFRLTAELSARAKAADLSLWNFKDKAA